MKAHRAFSTLNPGGWSCVALTLGLVAGLAGPLGAADFTVNTVVDSQDVAPGDGVCADSSGACSLRAAVMEANALPGLDRIFLAGGTYVLSVHTFPGDEASGGADDLDLADHVEIFGAGSVVTRQSSSCTGGWPSGEFRLFHVLPGVNVTMEDLTLDNGCAKHSGNPLFNSGGAILNQGNLVLRSIVFVNNQAGLGALANVSGSLEVVASTLTDNESRAAAVYVDSGQVVLKNVTISDNVRLARTGALRCDSGQVFMSFVTIADNEADLGYAQVQGSVSCWFYVKETLIAGGATNCMVHPLRFFTSGSNYAEDSTCPGFTRASLPLDPLANYGGPTPTRRLAYGNPALNSAGSCADYQGSPVVQDQRGISRPQKAVCDVGAFEARYYDLTVTTAGPGSGTVNVNPPGASCGSSCFSYPEGTNVTLTAVPDYGSVFAGWSGDPDCSDGQVTMDNAKTCVATFDLASFTLSVSKVGSGSGLVSSAPPGISCGATCSASFTYGTVVTLTATPDPGSTFAGWSGDPDCSDGQVVMDSDKNCTATFALNPTAKFLAVTLLGTGAGVVTSVPPGINCGLACGSSFPENSVVTLTATPAYGSSFEGWGGDPDCSDGQVTMNADKTCTATFELQDFLLVVNKTGSGSGKVTSDPAGIDCGSSCQATFVYNTPVTLTAAPEPDSFFGGWSGDCSGSEASVPVLVNRDLTCIASFQKRTVAELWLPVVANLAGAGGSYFYSDLVVSNVGSGVAGVDVTYFPAGGGAVDVEGFAEVGVDGQVIVEDVVGMLGKVGTKGVLRVRGTEPLLVVSRTYNKLREGNSLGLAAGTTFGQYVEGYRLEDGLGEGEEAYLLGLRQGVGYRSNLAVANVGSGPARVQVSLYKGNGTKVAEYELVLTPGQLHQDNEVFVARAGLSNVSGWAKVKVLSGSGVLAYASVLDNVATAGQKPSDPTTMLMKPKRP